jgi:hypothetical protein
MVKTIIKCLMFSLAFSLCSCSNYVYNNGVEREETTNLNHFKPGTLNLLSYRTTPRWDLLDGDSKAWVLVLPDGTFHFFPLGPDNSASQMLSTLGTIGQIMPAPVLPIPF